MRALEEPSAGHNTIDAVRPGLERWVMRRLGVLSQIISGNRCFGRWRIARAEATPECHHCECPHCECPEDTAQHTLAACSAWAVERAELVPG
ncbi:reverse transcriptase [Operophtera brumata]|uniref:Reverse transcriptase n=1 Tax=Operophtera brumata TaxID=104452 RepID=A0A0L7L447_OPEBR|nr:reverse transcriptase [Operophtera brumata]